MVPTPSAPEGYSAVWVGIGGFTCQNGALLQTGIDLKLVDDTVSYDGKLIRIFWYLREVLIPTLLLAWYEWYPAAPIFLDNIIINSRDEVRLTVVATSTTTGNIFIENLSNNPTVEQELSSTFPLCQESAEWIVEDFGSDIALVPFNNFGTVVFKRALALTAGGKVLTPDGAIISLVDQNDVVITSVDEGLLGVTISYNKTQ